MSRPSDAVKILISPNFIWKARRENDSLAGKEVAIMFCKDKDTLVLFGETMRLKPAWCYQWRGWHVFRLNPKQADAARDLGIEEGDWLGTIRSRRDSDCGSKKRFKSEHEAETSGQSLTNKSCVPLRPYLCPHCSGWHLTKQIDDFDLLLRARARKGRISQ